MVELLAKRGQNAHFSRRLRFSPVSIELNLKETSTAE